MQASLKSSYFINFFYLNGSKKIWWNFKLPLLAGTYTPAVYIKIHQFPGSGAHS